MLVTSGQKTGCVGNQKCAYSCQELNPSLNPQTNKERNKQTSWPESVSELYRLSGRCLSVKIVPIFSDRGCHMGSVTDPYSRNLGFLDRSRYFFFQVAPKLYIQPTAKHLTNWKRPKEIHPKTSVLVTIQIWIIIIIIKDLTIKEIQH
jgi:hypothetical protein